MIKELPSTFFKIVAIFLITSTGYLPTEVSPDNITASAPSMTELATSFTSALVGVSESIIVSIICVAIITGILAFLAINTNFFWIRGTSSAGTSTPKSPLATIIPSQYATIFLIFATPSGFSIFAMIGTLYSLLLRISFSSFFKSFAYLTKDRAIQSTPCSKAKRASFLSLLVNAGKDNFVFGRLTPFLELKIPPCITFAFTSSTPLVFNISNNNFPSSTKIRSPFFTSLGKSV